MDRRVIRSLQPVNEVSVLIAPSVVGAEIQIAYVTVTAVNEIGCPPTLIYTLKSRNLKAVYVGEEDKVVFPYRSNSLSCGHFFIYVIHIAAVKKCFASAKDSNISVSTRYRLTYLGLVVLVCKYVTVRSIGKPDVTIFQNYGEI